MVWMYNVDVKHPFLLAGDNRNSREGSDPLPGEDSGMCRT